MARPIWSGAINVGLVAIPVGLYSATEDHTIDFHQFQRGTSDRIRYKRVNERTGKEVDYDDIVKGHDLGDGDYVIVEPDELDEIAPGRSRTIDVETFVDLDQIDPIYFQKSYWLAPTKEEYAHSYGLLQRAMKKSNKAAVATFVMRGKQYLTAIRAGDGVMVLETMFFADEIRDPGEQLDLPKPGRARGKELDMALNLIEAMTGPWRPEEFRDTYTERVEKLVADKRKGNEVVTEAEPQSPTEVVDLMEALRRSMDRRTGGSKSGGRKSGGRKSGGRKSARTKATASKTTRSKATGSAKRPAGKRKAS